MTTVITALPYLYRDADNYKAWDRVLLRGVLTPEQVRRLRASLQADGDCWFLPDQVGLAHLGKQLENFPRDGDHVWHKLELEDIETFEVCRPQVAQLLDPEELITRFEAAAAQGWDVAASCEHHGITD